MRFLATVIALAVMLGVLVDAFEALVLPRRAMRKFRPARLYYRNAWKIWRGAADTFLRGAMRQHCLSWFGPFSLFGLFASWAAALIFAFALLQWAVAGPLGNSTAPPSIAECLYLSGETFFTLGYGDLAPLSWTGRLLSVLEAGTGFGFMAVVIGYLPVLYQAFSRRERDIALLDARAGSPPTAGEMIRRFAATSTVSQIEPLLAEWERWAAELLESQLSFPVLAFYRSQHDNQNWLAGLAVILDTCSVLLGNFPDVNRHQLQITFAMAACRRGPRPHLSRAPARDVTRAPFQRALSQFPAEPARHRPEHRLLRRLVRTPHRAPADVRAVSRSALALLRIRTAADHRRRSARR